MRLHVRLVPRQPPGTQHPAADWIFVCVLCCCSDCCSIYLQRDVNLGATAIPLHPVWGRCRIPRIALPLATGIHPQRSCYWDVSTVFRARIFSLVGVGHKFSKGNTCALAHGHCRRGAAMGGVSFRFLSLSLAQGK